MSSQSHDLVHFNLAMARYALDDPRMAGFTKQIEIVNQIASTSPGFLWTPEEGEAGDAVDVFGSALALANISTWRTVEELRRFVYSGLHGIAVTRRDEWFEAARGPAYVLWWAPSGSRPDWREAARRLEHLAAHGPAAYAFTFKRAFTANGEPLALTEAR